MHALSIGAKCRLVLSSPARKKSSHGKSTRGTCGVAVSTMAFSTPITHTPHWWVATGILNRPGAFEPDERFENPDGSAIIFDSNYLGEHRGIAVVPGPLASEEAAKKQIWQHSY